MSNRAAGAGSASARMEKARNAGALSRLIDLRRLAPILVATIALIVPATILAAGAPAQSAQVAALAVGPASIEAQLAARGLTIVSATSVHIPVAPPPGVEVDESVQSASDGGQLMARTRSWNEPMGSNTLHVELTTYPSGQYQVAFWIFPKESRGCSMFGWTMYDSNGQALKSDFWRNDRGLRITGAADFPSDLYPSFVPAVAFLRVIDGRHDGAQGRMDQQITPYGYVGLNVSIQDTEDVTVPAGTFSAFRVTSKADVATLLPSWSGLLLHMVEPFVPTSTYYFEAQAPYRLLKQSGTPFVGGPHTTSRLVRYFIAGSTASAATPGTPRAGGAAD